MISWVVTFFDGFDMNVIAFVAPDMSNADHLDRLMMGKVFSAGLLGTMIGGFLFGYIGDRIGRRPSIVFATASFGVLTLGFGLAGSYAALLVLRLADGIAIGGMLPLAWALNIEYVPRRYRSTVVTVIMMGDQWRVGGPTANWLIAAIRLAVVVRGRRSAIAPAALALVCDTGVDSIPCD